jgi:hypothetical protein
MERRMEKQSLIEEIKTPTVEFVKQAFLSILDRPPRPEELDQYTTTSFFQLYGDLLSQWRALQHDQELPVTKSVVANQLGDVPVLMLMRDDRVYCEYTLKRMLQCVRHAVQARGGRAHFYIYENDSIDGTDNFLHALQAGATDVTVLCEQLKHQKGTTAEFMRSSNRCSRMALYRNALVALAFAHVKTSAITLLVDTNVFFTQETIWQLVDAAITDNVTLALACTEDVHHAGHYYDTYAYVCVNDVADAFSRFRYNCPLLECTHCCYHHDLLSRRLHKFTLKTKRLHEVHSAFGGLGVIQSRYLMRSAWSSTDGLCEHVAFCRTLRQHGGRICVVPWARARWQMTLDMRALHNKDTIQAMRMFDRPYNHKLLSSVPQEKRHVVSSHYQSRNPYSKPRDLHPQPQPSEPQKYRHPQPSEPRTAELQDLQPRSSEPRSSELQDLQPQPSEPRSSELQDLQPQPSEPRSSELQDLQPRSSEP